MKKFSGPIESVISSGCPGESFCGIDECYRNGETCGGTGATGSGSCCMTVNMANDLLSSLGCGSGLNQNYTGAVPSFQSYSPFTTPKFATLGEDPTALGKCATQLNLTQDDLNFACTGMSSDDCFATLCGMGCTATNCPPINPPMQINLQDQICNSIQQYCDVLDPTLLQDPSYNALCCQVDPIAGVADRTVCGCPGNPCPMNPAFEQKIQDIKNRKQRSMIDHAVDGIKMGMNHILTNVTRPNFMDIKNRTKSDGAQRVFKNRASKFSSSSDTSQTLSLKIILPIIIVIIVILAIVFFILWRKRQTPSVSKIYDFGDLDVERFDLGTDDHLFV
jgi:hypothetical protein